MALIFLVKILLLICNDTCTLIWSIFVNTNFWICLLSLSTKWNAHKNEISINIWYWLDHWPQIYIFLKLWFSVKPQKLMPTNINETTVHDISFEAVRHSLCFSWFSVMWVFVEINYRLSTQHHSKTWSSHSESQSLESWQSASVTDIVYTLTTEGHSL